VKDTQAALGSFTASMVARGLRSVGRVTVVLVVARLYPIADVGRFVFVLGLGTLFVGLLDFGVTNLIQREFGASGFRAHALERSALRLRMVTLPVAIAASWLIGLLIDGGIGFASIGTLIFAGALGLSDFLAGLWRAKGDFVYESLELAPVLAGGLLTALTVGLLGGNMNSFQWALGIGALLPALVRAAIRSRALRTQSAHSRGSGGLFDLIWDARWFWVIAVCTIGLFELPIILLRALSTLEEVALLAVAMRAVGLVSQPFVVLGGVFLPSMAFQAREDRTEYLKSVRRANRILLLAIPAGLALGILGGTVLLRLFGEAYSASIESLWILTIGVLIGVGPVFGGALLVERKESGLALLALTAVGILVAASVLLDSTRGSVGAAAAAALAFSAIKAGHHLMYGRIGLPLYSLPDVLALAVTVAWIVSIGMLSEPLRYPLLGLGGLVGLAASARLLHETSLFDIRTIGGVKSGTGAGNG
jgi:O-antigen/teichoic acid export membrane protein